MNRLSSPQRASLIPAIIAMASVVLLVPGCSSGGSGEEAEEPSVTKTPEVTDLNSYAFPLASYKITPDDQVVLAKAQDELAVQCMKRFGFAYQPTPPQSVVSPYGEYGRRYGVSSPQLAAKYGYGDGVPDAEPAPAAADRLSGAARLAMFGQEDLLPSDLPGSQEEAEASGKGNGTVAGQPVPVGGCQRESALKMFYPRKDAVPQDFVFKLETDAWSRTREDSRYKDVSLKWAECMKEKGYNTSPDPLIGDRDLKFEDPETPQAVTAAKEDVACKERVNLIGIAFAVERAYQQRLVEQNAEALQKVQKQKDEQMRLASSLLG